MNRTAISVLIFLATAVSVPAQQPTPGAAPAARAPRSWTEGQPIEIRPPEKSDDKPAFPEQTRAPYHASAPFKITTLIDNLPAPWSLAFLPYEKIILTERLPGGIGILDIKSGAKGVLSEPVAGVAGLASPAAKDIGVLDPHFAANWAPSYSRDVSLAPCFGLKMA
jgi:aldose sugar dehydrogenase